VSGWYYNPNIYPPEEMRLRHQALAQAALALNLPLLPPEQHPDPAAFFLALARQPTGGPRCHACYQLRLEATARKAAEKEFEAFSTTLLISPYQDLEAIRRIGEDAAARHDLAFQFADLRARHPESRERARDLDLYRQRYCGCLFSDLERSEARSRRALRALAK